MSRYVDNNLRAGEEVILKARKNPLALFGSVLVMLILVALGIVYYLYIPMEDFRSIGFVLVAVGVLKLLINIIQFCAMTLVITNKRVIGKVGILKIRILDYPIDKVNAVETKSTFWGSIFHFQTVSLVSGNDKSHIQFMGISNANEFKNTVTDAIEKHQEDARRRQAEEIALAMRNADN